MALFPQLLIDEVKSAADIVTVISTYVSLRKAGASYKGLCPFHTEKTPSFNVNRDRGFFHCFSCGVGGDVVKFIELQEKLAFPEAVRHLAQRFGITVPELRGDDGHAQQDASERESLLRVHEVAARFYQEQLQASGGERIRRYLAHERGLTETTVAALGLGYAPPERDALRTRLRAEGFSGDVLLKSGLVMRKDDGREVDRFWGRLMVPIARDTGTIVAFGGRALQREQVPKYLNSPETPIYSKSRTLYGLHLTKGELRTSKVAVIVEGYFDFAQVYQAGGIPVIATCGTALTAAQAQLLRRFASKTVLCYDPDQAGQNAAERSCELLVNEGFDVNVAVLPGGADPDTFVQQHGREAYLESLRASRKYLDFLLERAANGRDLSRDDVRREFLRDMLTVAARVPDAAARDQFADRIAHRARVTEDVVRGEIRKAAAARRTELPATRVPAVAGGALRDVERGLLWALVHRPAEAIRALATADDDDLTGLRSQGVLVKARALQTLPAEQLTAALLGRLDENEAQLLSRVASAEQPPQLDVQECVRSLGFGRVERELAHLQREIDRLSARGSGPALGDLLRQKNALRSELDLARRGPRDAYNK